MSGFFNKGFIGFIAIAVLVGGAIFLLRDEADVVEKQELASQAELEEAEVAEVAEETQAEVEPGLETIELSAVNDYDASGQATRNYSEDDGYSHNIVASLPELADGKFYEGWIVGQGQVISTGEVLPSGDEWLLAYESEDNLLPQTDVVITIETRANGFDNIPEEHILEGQFLD